MNVLASKKLTASDTAILRHIARYRLTVCEAVARLPECQQHSTAKVLTRLKRLEDSGFVVSTWLYAERPCYILTADGASLVRSSLAEQDSNVPLSEATKIRRFAALSFCCLTSTRRQRLTAAELANLVRGVNGSDADTPYYATIDQSPACIGFLRVDLGGNGRWDRIVAKCQQDVRDHADDRVWAPWILANRFEVTLVTTLLHKAERLHREFSRQDHAPPIPVRIAVIPDLLYLIAPPPT